MSKKNNGIKDPSTQTEVETKKRLVIKVDQDRISEELTVGEFLAMQDGKFAPLIHMCSLCLYNEVSGSLYEPSEALEILKSLKLKELNELARQITHEMEGVAVPKEIEPN